MKCRFIAGGAVFLAVLGSCVYGKSKQDVPKETVSIPSPCVDVWQPLLHMIDDEYAIWFIYDPWYRVAFQKVSTSGKVIQSVFGGSLSGAGIELRNDPAAPNACVADVYGDVSLTPEVAAKIVAVLPGSKIAPHGSGKQKK